MNEDNFSARSRCALTDDAWVVVSVGAGSTSRTETSVQARQITTRESTKWTAILLAFFAATISGMSATLAQPVSSVPFAQCVGEVNGFEFQDVPASTDEVANRGGPHNLGPLTYQSRR